MHRVLSKDKTASNFYVKSFPHFCCIKSRTEEFSLIKKETENDFKRLFYNRYKNIF